MNEHDYKPDFEILDRYVKYSSEILRISMIIIAAMGSVSILKENFKIEEFSKCSINSFKLSIVFLAIAILFSLAHRYFATDYMSSHIITLRKGGGFNKKLLNLCEFLIVLNAITFAIGTILFLLGLFNMY